MALPAGSRVGPYEIVGRVGSGGMGEVYRAHDPRLGRDVAVKVIGDRIMSNAAAARRFEEEARAVAAISHANILAIHDFGVCDGVAYAAVELLEGETIRTRLSAGPFPLKQALEYARQIAIGMAAAHEKGIVHRDLKPENIFITTDGGVKILDFGLAQRAAAVGVSYDDDTETQPLEEVNAVVGTLGYMAPEQLRGGAIDHRADIFAFGVVLHEMLSGRRVFSGSSTADTIAAILSHDPPELHLPAGTVAPRVKGIVTRCLEKHPADRYQSARDLAHDLSSALAELLTPATSPHVVAAAPARRLRLVSFVALLVAILAAAAFVMIRSTVSHRDVPTQPTVHAIAVLPLQNLSRDPEQEFFADGMTDALIAQLAQIKALRVISRTSVMRFKNTHKSVADIGRELGVDAVVEGSVLRSAQRVRITAELVDTTTDQHLWAKTFERDLRDIIDLQNDVAREIAAGIRVRVSNAERNLLTQSHPVDPVAHENYMRGRYFWNLRTSDSLRKGLQYFNAAIETDPNYALGYAGIADSYAMLGAYTVVSPAESFPGARTAAMKALELNPQLAEPHATLLAVHLDYEWQWQDVEREYQAAMDINPSYVIARQWYAMYLSAAGLNEKALDEIERTRRLDPLAALVNTHVGAVLYHARQWQRAADECRKVLELEPNYLPAHWYLAHIYDELGRHDEAIAERETAVKLSPQPRYKSLLARSLALAGRREEAREILHEIERNAGGTYVSPLEMTFAYAALGDTQRALDYLEQAYRDRSWGMYRLKVDPKLDSLRAEPRFIAILKAMQFPADAPAGRPIAE